MLIYFWFSLSENPFSFYNSNIRNDWFPQNTAIVKAVARGVTHLFMKIMSLAFPLHSIQCIKQPPPLHRLLLLCVNIKVDLFSQQLHTIAIYSPKIDLGNIDFHANLSRRKYAMKLRFHYRLVCTIVSKYH